jgi:hypothetical protein
MRATATFACALAIVATAMQQPALARGGSTADIDAAVRAAGNRRPAAIALGRVLFRRVRPAQILKVRIDGAGRHEVAGLVLSAVKFHGRLDRAGFEREVIELVRGTFAASAVEEVDCWATVPFPEGAHVVVSGDMAQPTSRTVFGVTVRRDELAGFESRVRRGTDVYWDPAFATRLDRGGGPGASST